MIDHIKLWVSDLARSRAFYEQALEPLGYRVMMENVPSGTGLGDKYPRFWIAEGEATVCHVAFRADGTETVDAFYRAALDAGGSDNGPPGLRPQYHDRYYGAFVLEPDGNNVEAVCSVPES